MIFGTGGLEGHRRGRLRRAALAALGRLAGRRGLVRRAERRTRGAGTWGAALLVWRVLLHAVAA